MTSKPKQRAKNRPTPSIRESRPPVFLTRLGSWRWSPYALFLILALIYFGGFLTSDVAIFGSDNSGGRYFAGGSVGEALKSYRFTNWSRWQGGTPMSDSLPGEQFFPTSLLHFFLIGYRALGFRIIILAFCAGAFMYLFLRQIGLNKTAATLCGLGYMFSPTFLSFTYAGHDAKMSVIAMFPLLLFFIEKGLSTGRLFHFLCFGGALGIAIFSPHLQMVYFSLWGVGLYVAFRIGMEFVRERDGRAAFRRALLSVAGLFLGCAIGAMALVPPYLTTKTVSKRAGGVSPEYAASWSLHPEEMGSLVVPEFGSHLDNYWGRNPFKLNSEYFGVGFLVLAILSFVIVRSRTRLWPYCALFWLALLFSLGSHTPLHRLFYDFAPGVKSLRASSAIAFLFAFPAIVCAGFAIHSLTTPGSIDLAHIRKALLWLGFIVGGLLLLVGIAPEAFSGIWTSLIYSGISEDKRQIMVGNLPNVSRGALISILLLGILLPAAFYRAKGRLSNSAFFGIAALLIVFDTWRIDRQFLVYIDPYPQKPTEGAVVEFLKKDPDLFRVLALPDGRNANLPGVDIVNGFYDFTNKRYDEIQKSERFGTMPVLNLLNTKYVVSKEPLAVQGVDEVLKADGRYVYRNPNALPWFFLAGAARVVGAGQAFDAVSDPAIDLRHTVILEDDPGVALSNDGSPAGVVEKLDYQEEAGYMKLRVEAKRPGFLVVCENYHPKWKAFVDGKETKIYRADHVWKAVSVKQGTHTVEFRYRSKLASVCRWVSLATALACAVAIGAGQLSTRSSGTGRAKGRWAFLWPA